MSPRENWRGFSTSRASTMRPAHSDPHAPLPYHIHRLASPPAAARTTTFTDSPRPRLRLVLPHSQTRLAPGCGSYYHIHRLASPPAAARTTTFIIHRLASPPA